MNWITTNIRLPEEDYMELKLDAVRRRTSFGALIREKLKVKQKTQGRKGFWERLDRSAERMAQKYPHSRLSEKLIEMRYEQ